MTTLTASRPTVKPTRNVTRRAARDWPASPEVDGDNWELGPDPADAQHWADQNTDHHFDGPTPDEALGDGPEPDWDGLAEESAALDRLCAGCLL